jgi:protein phosphatase
VFTENTLRLITNDHTVVGSLVRKGVLTPEAARIHENRSALQQAVGLPRGITPDFGHWVLKEGDRVLICSDGLWEPLPETEISEVLAADGSMRQIATVLVDRAIVAGGDDNITAVVYRHTSAVSIT